LGTFWFEQRCSTILVAANLIFINKDSPSRIKLALSDESKFSEKNSKEWTNGPSKEFQKVEN
jgi:hypothetical protein